MFDKDKLTLASMVCFKIMIHAGQLDNLSERSHHGKVISNAGTMGPLAEWMPVTVGACEGLGDVWLRFV